MAISTADFDFIRTLVLQKSAIVLDTNKSYLAENRLSSLANSEGFLSLGDMLRQLKQQNYGLLQQKVVEAMTTNETSFFRDNNPFVMIEKTLLPQLIEAKKGVRELTIWSAAASTGQEAYTIAMIIKEHYPELLNWRLKIIGTDLAENVIEKAKRGVYSQLEINRGLPIRLLSRYFVKEKNDWAIAPEIKKLVEFKTMNLVGPWAVPGTIDLILIRNVLIYFDTAIKREILDKAFRLCHKSGMLMLGGSETTIGVHEGWSRVDCPPSHYYRPGAK